jgi:ATP-dependent RNA helicase DDX3X
MSWDTKDMAEALTTAEPSSETPVAQNTAAAPKKNPQEAGWVEKQPYDYDTYNKSSKELYDEGLAPGGLGAQDWASNAAKYEWDEEYGDVGPEFLELEKQLFGGENRMRTGIEFSK